MTETTLPASPCTGICRLDPATKWCQGCRRTLDEIGDWPAMDREQRLAVLTEARKRLAEDEKAGRVLKLISLRG